MGLIKQIFVFIAIVALIYIVLFVYLAFFREDFADLSKLEIFMKAPKLLWEVVKEI